MNKVSKRRVMVLGGYGVFGNLISSSLARITDVTVAGRNQVMGQKFANSIEATFTSCNVKDEGSLRNTIAGAHIVVNASGPFHPNDYSIPKICMEENCHYIDLADNRDYVKDFPQLNDLAKNQGVFACTGASTAPAVTHALISELRPKVKDIQSIKIFLSAGNKNKAGMSTFESILSYAGTPIPVWNNSQWETIMGWGSPEIFRFPMPVGKRIVQLCNVPDLELFPRLFKADQVIFKAGMELPIFNGGLFILAQFKKHFPAIDLSTLAKHLVRLSDLFKSMGSFSGGISVIIEDRQKTKQSITFVTSKNGPQIPVSPAILLARKLLSDNPPAHGAFPCVGFIKFEEFQNYLEPFGIELIR